MSKRYAVIKDGVCIAVVAVDPDVQPDWVYPLPHDEAVSDNDRSASVGDLYDKGTFIKPKTEADDELTLDGSK